MRKWEVRQGRENGRRVNEHGAQPHRGPLGDEVEDTSELSREGVRKLRHLSTMPISQWLTVPPGAVNCQALPLLTCCEHANHTGPGQ